MGYGRDPARRERHNGMVEALQRKAMQVGKITRDMQFGNLPLSVTKILVATQYPFDQKRAVFQLDAGMDENMVGRVFTIFSDRVTNRGFFF